MIWPSRKSIGFRKAKANDARKSLDIYRRSVTAQPSPVAMHALAQVAADLCQMVARETGHGVEAAPIVNMLFDAHRDLREIARGIQS